jgi:hypothetical protein
MLLYFQLIFIRHQRRIFSMAQQPLVGQGLLIIEATWSHPNTPHSAGLGTSDQPVTETCTRKHTALMTDRHPCPGWIRNLNPSKRAAADPRLRPRTLGTIERRNTRKKRILAFVFLVVRTVLIYYYYNCCLISFLLRNYYLGPDYIYVYCDGLSWKLIMVTMIVIFDKQRLRSKMDKIAPLFILTDFYNYA